jgi:hypothetical protein
MNDCDHVQDQAAGAPAQNAPPDNVSYEPPRLIRAGNLRDLLGKTGKKRDFSARIPGAFKPS